MNAIIDVKYIPETKEFIVNGKTIKESELTFEEKQKLMKVSKQATLIVGESQYDQSKLIL